MSLDTVQCVVAGAAQLPVILGGSYGSESRHRFTGSRAACMARYGTVYYCWCGAVSCDPSGPGVRPKFNGAGKASATRTLAEPPSSCREDGDGFSSPSGMT
ncbi:hypothetical protein BHM03_00004877 [Ensete ventricosum]|nr:hypothetical protein BHM03_00004877 [Ensete ventricosum]